MSTSGSDTPRRIDGTAADSAAVSVVMPVGSVDDRLEQALQHLVDQETTFTWDFVISLNTPDTSAARELEDMLDRCALEADIVDSSQIRSASYARNSGGRRAQGNVLVFCDGDDEAAPGWLQAIVGALEPGTAVGGHLAEDRLMIAGQESWRPPATPGGLPSFLGADYLVSANMAVWASDFEAVGGFDETLLRGEDIDFGWKLLERGIELRYAGDAVVDYRHRAGLRSLLEQHYLYGRGMAQVLARRNPPGSDGGSKLLKANGQKVHKRSVINVARRGAIAVGRLHGLLDARRIEKAPPVPAWEPGSATDGESKAA